MTFFFVLELKSSVCPDGATQNSMREKTAAPPCDSVNDMVFNVIVTSTKERE